MNLNKNSVKDLYNTQIVTEIKNITARPLGYNGSKLLEILDEFELDYRVNNTYGSFYSGTLGWYP